MFGQVRCVVVAERHANQKPDSAIIGGKIVLGTIVVAVLAAAIVITVVLLQDNNSGPTTAAVPTVPSTTPTSGVSTKKVLDKSALEGDSGIKKILIESYGVPVDQIHRVDCPAGQEVEPGNTFTCTVQIGDDRTGAKLVDVKVIDDNGEYEVGPPRDK